MVTTVTALFLPRAIGPGGRERRTGAQRPSCPRQMITGRQSSPVAPCPPKHGSADPRTRSFVCFCLHEVDGSGSSISPVLYGVSSYVVRWIIVLWREAGQLPPQLCNMPVVCTLSKPVNKRGTMPRGLHQAGSPAQRNQDPTSRFRSGNSVEGLAVHFGFGCCRGRHADTPHPRVVVRLAAGSWQAESPAASPTCLSAQVPMDPRAQQRRVV